MGILRVFLDANILFSAALGGPSFALIWELAKTERFTLLSSRYCLLEAERNLSRKRPETLARWNGLLEQVEIVPEAQKQALAIELPEKDVPVYNAALEGKADVLLTGDVTHFGNLMEREDLPVRVRTVRSFLLQKL